MPKFWNITVLVPIDSTELSVVIRAEPKIAL